MRSDYEQWLRLQGYGEGTITAQLHRVGRVEQHYGSLDQHHAHDRLAGLIDALTYSTEDQRRGRPNPTKIPFVGNTRNNLASYKSSVLWYRRFLENGLKGTSPGGPLEPRPGAHALPDEPQRRLGPRRHAVRIEPRAGAKTLTDFALDGRAALEAVIASSQYRTVAQAVASLTAFTHPETVLQTRCQALFPAVRDQKRVGQIGEANGRRVLLDDNLSPTCAFLWANRLTRRGPDTQINHIWAASGDPDAYTTLPNLCMTPAFIAKLTDTSAEIRRLLEYRSYMLYGWRPSGEPPPERPDDYEVLEWAAPLPAAENVEAALVEAMQTKPKNRVVIAVRELGWLFREPA